MIELAITVILIVTLATLFIRSQKGNRPADTRALAQRVAAELNAARQRATTEGFPVAVIVPSQGGTRPHAQSLYRAEGHQPRIVSVANFANEHPRSCVAAGVLYPTSTIDQPFLATNNADFDLVAWVGATGLESDYIFCFTPSGALVTNDLPTYEGNYHLLISAGLEFSLAGNPGGSGWGLAPTYYRPDLVSSPRMVTVSATGLASVGPLDPNTSIAEGEGLGFASAPAVAATIPVSTSSAPIIHSVEVYPEPNPADLPVAADVRLELGAGLTLKVIAGDSDSEKLLLSSWTSDRGGAFSKPPRDPMHWDPDARGTGVGAWVSTVEWSPPPGTAAGEEFVITATVEDPAGATTSSVIGTSGKVKIAEPSVILFTSRRDGTDKVWSMNPDGTDKRPLTKGGTNGRLSTTGNIIYGLSSTLYLQSLKGEDVTAVTAGGSLKSPHDFNPKGTRVFYITYGPLKIHTGLLKGEISMATHALDTDPGFVGDSNWSAHPNLSPDGTKLLYTSRIGGRYKVMVADFDDTAPATGPFLTGGPVPTQSLIPGSTQGMQADWSPDGTKIFYICNNDVYSMDFDPATNTSSNWTNITNSSRPEQSPRVSPDGSMVAYSYYDGTSWEVYRCNADGSNPINLTNDPSNESLSDWRRF